jgi:hypothetical protein
VDAFGLAFDMGFAIAVVVVVVAVVAVVANVTWVVGLAMTVLHWIRKMKVHDDVRLQRVLATSVHRTRKIHIDPRIQGDAS